MSTTYLMSYPGKDWQLTGNDRNGKPFPPSNPQRAFREWLALCDAITRAGGHILVMPPPAVDPPLSGMVYTANLGCLFRTVFMLSRMAEASREAEVEFGRLFIVEAGLTCDTAKQVWEGQADLHLIAGNRYIASWGGHTKRESLEDIRPHLPSGARLLEVQIKPPHVNGNSCLNTIFNRAGMSFLMAHGSALQGTSLEGLRNFTGVDVYPVDEDDTALNACQMLCVNGQLIVPNATSTSLRGQLLRRGFTLEELDLPELYVGGGPRTMVNELRGVVTTPGAPEYAHLREELIARSDSYPESLAPPKPTTPPVAAPPPTDPTKA